MAWLLLWKMQAHILQGENDGKCRFPFRGEVKGDVATIFKN